MKKQWQAGGVVLAALLIGGCGKTGNLFSFTHKTSDAATETNVTVLVADAIAAVEAGDYVKAEQLYQKVVDQNPTSSEARIGVVNAVTKQIQQAGLDLLSLSQNMTNQTSSSPMLYGMFKAPRFYATKPEGGYYLFGKDPVAQYKKVGTTLTLKHLENLYKAFITHLGPVCRGETDLAVNKVPSVYFANLSFGYLLRGVIRVADKDENGEVDYLIFYRDPPGEYEVYLTTSVVDDTQAPTGTKLTQVPGFDKASGLADLDNAIVHMGNAKTYSKDVNATLWADLLTLLTEARKMISDLSI